MLLAWQQMHAAALTWAALEVMVIQKQNRQFCPAVYHILFSMRLPLQDCPPISTAAAMTDPKRAQSRHNLGCCVDHYPPQFQHSPTQATHCAIKKSAGVITTIAGRWQPRLRQAVAQPWRRSTLEKLTVNTAAQMLQHGKIQVKVSARCISCGAFCARKSFAAWGPNSSKTMRNLRNLLYSSWANEHVGKA